ncbi:ribosomal protein S5, C-terminal domain-containing protein [Peziza echinospora]|nr:ribosomal protein S5, C-terminal domain-containing protein [Peziza echinospora]
MSVTRPLHRLLAQTPHLLRASTTTPPPIRTFTTTPTPPLPRRRPSRPISLPSTPSYTPSQIEKLSEHYTPQQLATLLTGDAAIDPYDFDDRQPRDAHDPYKLAYLTDLSTLDPLLDFPPDHEKYTPPNLGHPKQPLPVITDPEVSFPEEEAAGVYRGEELSRLTGFSAAQLKKFTIRSMVFHRVVNQTRMGKIQRFYALNIAGNGNGLLGIGEGKSAEPGDAGQIASYMALRNLEPIPRYEGRTIHGKVKVKIGAVELELRSAPPGYGIRASEPIFEMCRALGIQDLSAKISRSTNRMNVVKAVMHGLRSQKLPDVIARGRGIKLADVRKVYYNGANMGSSSHF